MMIRHAETSFRERNYNDTLSILNQFRILAGITRLADLTYLDYSGLPVYTAIRPRAKSLTTSQGKGLTKEAAQCSALMESIEVYFAEELVPKVTNKSEIDLIRDHVHFISINHLAKAVRFTKPSKKLNWVKAELLFSGRKVLVPFAEYSLNSYLSEVLIYSPDTTGLAGGNTYKEALLHGILEVMERQGAQQKCEISQINISLINKASTFFEFKIVYEENIYEVPSFEVLIKSKNRVENQILFKGNGCHLNKTIALNRAFTEAIQSRVTTIAGSRDDLINTKYNTEVSQFPISLNKKKFNEIPNYSIETVNDALEVLYKKVKKNNQDILVYKYYDKEICILKVKLVSMEIITHV